MNLKNTTSAAITIGSITVPAGGTQDVPWQYVANSGVALASMLSGGLVPTVQDPDISPLGLSTPLWGTWLSPYTIAANDPYTVPNTPFVGFFSSVRLYSNTTAGSATLTVSSSPDGGTTWYPLSDFGPLALTNTLDSWLLPKGIVLVQFDLVAGAGGWTGSLAYTVTSGATGS